MKSKQITETQMTLSEKTEKRHKYLQFVDNMHNKTTMR